MSDDNNESDSPAGMVENIGEQVASGLEGAAEGMADDEGNEDVAKGLETAGDVAAAASQGAAMVEGAQEMTEALREGDGLEAASAAGDYLGGLAGATGAVFDGAADLVDNEGVREVLQTASSVSRGISGAVSSARQVISTAEDIVQSVMGQKVKYELHLDGEGEWKVQGLTLTETISEPYEMVLEVKTDDRDADPRALVGAEAELLIERGDEHHRRVTGVVRRVEESDNRSHYVSARVYVVPALWALGQGADSLIFQDKTAVEILEAVLSRTLGYYGREVDVSGLGDGYARREYCVQYRESSLAFCQRLMEEEGISYGFDASGEGHEKLILWDRNSGVARVPTANESAIPFRGRVGVVTASNEPIVEMAPARKMTETGIYVRDYDWTRDRPRVDARTGDSLRRIYDHGHGRTVSLYNFQPGQRYEANDVEQQTQRRHEALVRDADVSTGTSLVIGLAPGLRFEVTDHPTPGMDGEYLVTRVVHRKAPPEGGEHHAEGEAYSNTFECIPFDVEYRSKRRTPKPSIFGSQTAMVTGGNPGEIATDEYGRVRVLFHWDQSGAEPTSCWLRVAQVWAGHDGMGHPGFLFIPRVGMEVIVTFMNGDPDRPMVTGSVYNGNNLPPAALPDEASRSMIRTRSLNGTGYNELSFEDASGKEEVHLRAERNLRELVQHDHDTHVLHDQSNTVDKNQTEEVGEDQELTVHGKRTKTVDKDEYNVIKNHRKTQILGEEGGHDFMSVTNNRIVRIGGKQYHSVHGSDDTHVIGPRTLHLEGGLKEMISKGVIQTVDGGWSVTTTGGWTTNTTGSATHNVDGLHQLSTTQGIVHNTDAAHVTDAAVIQLRSQTSIIYSAPQGFQSITPAKEENIAEEFLLNVADWFVNGGRKIGMYYLAVTIVAGIKLDVVDTKMDVYLTKLSKEEISFKTIGVALKNAATARLVRAGIHLIT